MGIASALLKVIGECDGIIVVALAAGVSRTVRHRTFQYDFIPIIIKNRNRKTFTIYNQKSIFIHTIIFILVLCDFDWS